MTEKHTPIPGPLNNVVKIDDELLNETVFRSLNHARELLAEWRDDYNGCRPHTSLAGLTPYEFATRSQRDHSQNGLHL